MDGGGCPGEIIHVILMVVGWCDDGGCGSGVMVVVGRISSGGWWW